MAVRVLIRDSPHRSIALKTDEHVLTFRHSQSGPLSSGLHSSSQTSLGHGNNAHGGGGHGDSGASGQRCIVEFAPVGDVDLTEYRAISLTAVHGTLGLITIQDDVFLCVVSGATKVATVRPGETVQRILAVEFYCLNRASFDNMLNSDANAYHTHNLDDDGFDYGSHRDNAVEHPCISLQKSLAGGSFFYSADFDLTRRLQKRSSDTNKIALESINAGFLWNSYMIKPLVDFRSRLSEKEMTALDESRLLTSAIRGFVSTVVVPSASSPIRSDRAGLASTLTLISRLSSRKAGTRFNSRGIDDEGNVANYVETETVFWSPTGVCFSYTQIRGSVPLFWEQAAGLLPGQQKISVARSAEATKPAFDRHFEMLKLSYGAVHVVNLLSREKVGELELSSLYRQQLAANLSTQHKNRGASDEQDLLKMTDYDFHAETRGSGYEAASAISRHIVDSAESFAYFLSEDYDEHVKVAEKGSASFRRTAVILQQEGVFRTNCLDCLDRTNLVQTIISKMALEAFLHHRAERGNGDFWARHSTLWADNGDALSKIYAGTGALKSSFTRHGKATLAGALADARKSATRMFINNFSDKARQETIDILLGRQIGQAPVHLFDPINDFVDAELKKRAGEYSSYDVIRILVGTFNVNGRSHGIREDLSAWLCPKDDQAPQDPEIVVVGFQEIVELSPQQIMSTDPARRQEWEQAVKHTLNKNAEMRGSEEYVLLRGGQLVGASLSIFVKAGVLKHIKNVEGSLKKTGLSGTAGNKGAVAIRMDFANSSLCFVTAHLAAGFANYEERNRDFKTIDSGLKFQRNRMIEDHESVIWLGDFNYRIGLSDDKVRKLISVGDLESLYDNDQLNVQMVAGLAFPFYAESRITFPPTYKYDNGTDNYDTSEKQRIPAWTDRVLRRGDNLRQTCYATGPLRFSDHRPVYAGFQCRVSVIDQKKKDQLSSELYAQRRVAVGNGTATAGAGVVDTDDEDLIGYESIEPGLPPASSQRRKWWLDNSQPARSTVQPPTQNHVSNPSRPSNPFTPTSESDWVHVGKPSPTLNSTTKTLQSDTTSILDQPNPTAKVKPAPPPPRGTLTSASRSQISTPVSSTRAPDPPLRHRLPPPLVSSSSQTSVPTTASSARSTAAPPELPLATKPRTNTANAAPPALPARSPSSASVTSVSTTASRKATAPPVPRKPVALTSPSSPPPPPTPTATSTQSKAPPTTARTNTKAPSLPPRQVVANGSRANGTAAGNSGPMDEREDEMQGLGAWEVLRPGQAD